TTNDEAAVLLRELASFKLERSSRSFRRRKLEAVIGRGTAWLALKQSRYCPRDYILFWTPPGYLRVCKLWKLRRSYLLVQSRHHCFSSTYKARHGRAHAPAQFDQ